MPLVKETAIAWWGEKEKSIYPHQQAYYRDFLNLYILRFLGEEELSSLTENRMDSYFTQVLFEQTYRNNIGRKKVKYGKSILQEVFDFALERGMADRLPKADLTFRINQTKQIAPDGCNFQPETVERVKNLIESERGLLTSLAFGLAWYAGFTREEMLSLKWRDLDFVHGLITHVDGREIWLEEPLHEMLLLYYDENKDMFNEYIFISKRNTRFAGPSLSRLVKTAKEKYAISDTEVNLNALRNNYILRKLNTITTEELPFLAKGLGISPISMLNKYGQYLVPSENRVKGIEKGFYKSNRDYWIAQLSRNGVNGASAERILDVLIQVMATALTSGDVVDIDDFGLFYVRTLPERYERNLLTLEFCEPREERELVFVPYPKLLLAMNFMAET